MAGILNWIMDSIRLYGPWSVFIGVIVESVIVPIPSPLIIMGAGPLPFRAALPRRSPEGNPEASAEAILSGLSRRAPVRATPCCEPQHRLLGGVPGISG